MLTTGDISCCMLDHRGLPSPPPAVGDPSLGASSPIRAHKRVEFGLLLLPHPFPLAAGEGARQISPDSARPFFNLRQGPPCN